VAHDDRDEGHHQHAAADAQQAGEEAGAMPSTASSAIRRGSSGCSWRMGLSAEKATAP
jgi:hypothetical protein